MLCHLIFMSASEILWKHIITWIKSKPKISQISPPFFFLHMELFSLISYLFFTSLPAESTLRKDSIPILLFLLRQTFEKNAFKILLFPIWRRWEKKEPLFNSILENHVLKFFIKVSQTLKGAIIKDIKYFSFKTLYIKKKSVYFLLPNIFSTNLDGALSNLV